VVAITKDGNEGPIPLTWRPALAAIVDALIDGDPPSLPQVSFQSSAVWEHAQAYIRDYGAQLVTLPEETWSSSICIWHGTYWCVLVDLFTEEEGMSDLVLQVHVHEDGDTYRYEVALVYVP